MPVAQEAVLRGAGELAKCGQAPPPVNGGACSAGRVVESRRDPSTLFYQGSYSPNSTSQSNPKLNLPHMYHDGVKPIKCLKFNSQKMTFQHQSLSISNEFNSQKMTFQHQSLSISNESSLHQKAISPTRLRPLAAYTSSNALIPSKQCGTIMSDSLKHHMRL
jgi:hypothetical protein